MSTSESEGEEEEEEEEDEEVVDQGTSDDDGEPMPEQASPGHRQRERQMRQAERRNSMANDDHHSGRHGKVGKHGSMPKAQLNRRASHSHDLELEEEMRRKQEMLDLMDPKKRKEVELRYARTM